jgi:hypothetical protein
MLIHSMLKSRNGKCFGLRTGVERYALVKKYFLMSNFYRAKTIYFILKLFPS